MTTPFQSCRRSSLLLLLLAVGLSVAGGCGSPDDPDDPTDPDAPEIAGGLTSDYLATATYDATGAPCDVDLYDNESTLDGHASSDGLPHARNANQESPALWTAGVVPYELADGIDPTQQVQVQYALDSWSRLAQVTFVARDGEADYVEIKGNATHNQAAIGMLGGRQEVTLSTWTHPMLLHELGHSLGFHHEHQRPDRDSFIEVHASRIRAAKRNDLVPLRPHPMLTPYNFLSIMHYRAYSGATSNAPTMTPRPGYEDFAYTMGSSLELAGGDQFSVATLYGARPIAFPDPEFAQFLVTRFDTNGDGRVDTAEVARVTSLRTPGQGHLQDLTGIEWFADLTTLDCNDESLTALPPLPPGLTTLSCARNRIATPFPSEAEAEAPRHLEYVDLRGNQLDAEACGAWLAAAARAQITDLLLTPQGSPGGSNCQRDALIDLQPRTETPLPRLPAGATVTYRLQISAAARSVRIELTNRDGLPTSLRVRRAAPPTATTYDGETTSDGSAVAVVSIPRPSAGTWYLQINATRGISNKTLQARLEPDDTMRARQPVHNGLPEVGLASTGGAVVYVLSVPEGAAELTFASAGGTGNADLYVRRGQAPTTATFTARSRNAGNDESLTVEEPTAGLYFVRLFGSTFSQVKLIGYWRPRPQPVDPPAPTQTQTGDELQSGVPRVQLSAAQGDKPTFRIVVPAQTQRLQIDVSGGQGDADLYVRRSYRPTLENYDHRPYEEGNDEHVSIDAPQAGTWFVMLYAFRAFRDVQVVATLIAGGQGNTSPSGSNSTPDPSELVRGVARTNLAAATGASLRFHINVPAGAAALRIQQSGGTGDADLYAKHGTAPTQNSYDARPYLEGNDESISIAAPAPGVWHIMQDAYATFAGARLVVDYDVTAPNPAPAPAPAPGNTNGVFENATNVPIPDNQTNGVASAITVVRPGDAGGVKVTVHIVHTYVGDLTVNLQPPQGSAIVLRDREGGSANNIDATWTVDAIGKPAAGTWKLVVRDTAQADVGYIDRWSLQFP